MSCFLAVTDVKFKVSTFDNVYSMSIEGNKCCCNLALNSIRIKKWRLAQKVICDIEWNLFEEWYFIKVLKAST